jgi:hypothetical protein
MRKTIVYKNLIESNDFFSVETKFAADVHLNEGRFLN